MADRKHSLRRKRELYYIFLIVAVGGILALSFLGPNGYFELKKARLEMQQRQVHVDELKRSNAERVQTIKSLKSDKAAIERYARRKGYARENEIIEQLPVNPEEHP